MADTGDATQLSIFHEELIRRLHWFMRLRWLAAGMFLAATWIGANLLHVLARPRPLYILAFVIAFYNLLFVGYARTYQIDLNHCASMRAVRVFSNIQVLADLAALTLLLHYTGGIENPLQYYFVFHIIIAGVLLPPAETLLHGVCAALFFGTVVILEYLEILPHNDYGPFMATAALHSDPWYVFCSLGVWTSTVAISIFMATSVGARLRQREQELVASAAERRKLEAHLEQARKLEAIGELAGGVAHDFNNQLAGISGYAELLEVDLAEKDPELAQFASSIMQCVKHSSELTSKLLAFARKGKAQSVAVDVHGVIQEVVAMLEHSIDRRIRVLQHLDADTDTVDGDPSQLQNMLLNLGINARDAMPGSGDLTFATEVVELDAAFCRRDPATIEPGRYLQILVSDTGCGMSPEIQKRIFEPFFTTKEKGKGTGMGLAAAYGTVKNHRGTISVYSELSRGTTFKVYLPLISDLGKTQAVPPPHAVVPADAAHILLVDDEESVRTVGEELLKRMGHRITTCVNGREALASFRECWQDIDLVILDMVMPEMGGEETFLAMREINPNLVVLLSSGYSLNGQAQHMIQTGVKGFLQKPFKRHELMRAVSEALATSVGRFG